MITSELKKTKNWYRCVGEVNENALKLEEKDIKTEDGIIHGQVVSGKVSIKCEDGIHTFNCYFSSHNTKPDKNGKYENSRWNMALSMLDWNPAIGEKRDKNFPATLVNIEGSIDINDYSQNGEVKSIVRMNISKASTKVNAADKRGCSWSGVMYIKNIRPEVYNEEETGRLIVDLIGVNGKGEVFPVKAFVEADLADDFEQNYEAEQTVNMDVDVVAKHIGAKKSLKKAFGRSGSVDVNSGYDIEEFIIVGADEPIEEPEEEEENSIWLNPKAIKKALKERDVKLQSLNNKEEENKAKTKKSAVEPYNDDDDDLF